MTKNQWLEYEAARTGKTVEEVREEMRRRSKLAVQMRGLTGTQLMTPEKHKEISSKGGIAKNDKKD